MQRTADGLVFSPSDLNHYLECAHLVRLDLEREPDAPRSPRSAHAELLATLGQDHERAWLRRFMEQGRRVASIDPPPEETGRRRDWEADATRTTTAMRDGADVVYQGVFAGGDWHGIADFLIKVEGPSALGGWHYEAWDTKLARRTKPYFVVQLCYYTEQLSRLQGREPRDMVVVLGTGAHDRLRFRDFDAYYRKVRGRFLEVMAAPQETYPYPVSHCGFCEHREACRAQWTRDDHPSQVAGIRREQVDRLARAGICTVEQLAAVSPATARGSGSSISGIGASTLARLQHQARLQTDHRRTGVHRYEMLEADETSGFRLLPRPSAGDVFFDLEGDPVFEPAGGLEYLWGRLTVDAGAPAFHAVRAVEPGRERAREKEALEDFIDLVGARLESWPDLHVYHYGSYEVSALKRLAAAYATREDALDDLLRREIFVDLYQVVRQSLRTSHGSYSIKNVRGFFMPEAGRGTVAAGDDSILEFERWRHERDPSILDAIVAYNEEDCVSTLRLRDWLLERRGEVELRDGVAIPWKAVAAPKENEKREEEDARTALRRERLLALDTREANLLADLVNYHRRESKPAWWAWFDRRKKSLDQLLDDTEAIAFLTPADTPPEPDRKSLIHTLVFPEQEHKLKPGQDVEDPIRGGKAGTIVEVDDRTRRLTLRRGPTLADLPLPRAISAGGPLDDRAQREAIGRVADAVIADDVRYGATRALLARDLPTITTRLRGSTLQTMDLQDQREMVTTLDNSYLFIQGPPGSGKTYAGARLITHLIAAGKRIGVAALSHKAINNLLAEVERVAEAEGLRFTGLKKCSGEDDAFDGKLIGNTTKNEDCEAGSVTLVAGTSWLFARRGMDGSLDYLFIDEAGQLSLADTVAMSTSARNLVLLGDPQQLPQIRQGTHPEGAGVSSLEHLLGDYQTVPGDRGIFQERTYRMHPDVCQFVSALAYDGRLRSAEGLERQRIESNGLEGSGLRYVPVPHTGNAQQSTEEAEAIAAHVRTLLDGGTFTDQEGNTRPLTPQDILVVAPYNMQVARLRDALTAHGGERVEAGTVDKFQGREAPVVFFSMASSSGEDVPRGVEFLFSRNRFNVAISRARALAAVVCSPSLLDARCTSVDQMRLTNNLCRFVEQSLCVS